MLKNFFKSERGDSNFVAIIVIVAIILVVAVVFRDKLKEAIEAIFGKINSFINQAN